MASDENFPPVDDKVLLERIKKDKFDILTDVSPVEAFATGFEDTDVTFESISLLKTHGYRRTEFLVLDYIADDEDEYCWYWLYAQRGIRNLLLKVHKLCVNSNVGGLNDQMSIFHVKELGFGIVRPSLKRNLARELRVR